jgi:hypothetical protein
MTSRKGGFPDKPNWLWSSIIFPILVGVILLAVKELIPRVDMKSTIRFLYKLPGIEEVNEVQPGLEELKVDIQHEWKDSLSDRYSPCALTENTLAWTINFALVFKIYNKGQTTLFLDDILPTKYDGYPEPRIEHFASTDEYSRWVKKYHNPDFVSESINPALIFYPPPYTIEPNHMIEIVLKATEEIKVTSQDFSELTNIRKRSPVQSKVIFSFYNNNIKGGTGEPYVPKPEIIDLPSPEILNAQADPSIYPPCRNK